jgi:chemotaxis protein CheC
MSALQNAITAATNFALNGLSEVVGESLPCVVREVEIVEISNNLTAPSFSSKQFGIVQLECSGLLNADVFLMFDSESVSRILQKMLGAEADAEMIQECENDAMCELGNIMINGYLSSIADFLHTPFESTLPTYRIESNANFIESMKVKMPAIFITSHIDLNDEKFTSEIKILFLTNRESLNNLIELA